MNKLYFIIALILLYPLNAMANTDEDITIRVLEMHEKTPDSIVNRIELPSMAGKDSEHTSESKNPSKVQKHSHDSDNMFEPELENQLGDHIQEQNEIQNGAGHQQGR